jgi:ribonuclease VapC
MIIDTSAIVAVVRKEPLGLRCFDAIMRAPIRRVSAANLLEIYMVIDGGKNPVLSNDLDVILASLRMNVEPVSETQVQIAFRQFGKGSGHPARLNFGDCFAYALARYLNEPLLFVGNDFAQTDILPVAY